MVTYIYFVKCPGCEDEHFDFFDEAKGFAMGCLSKKPIITQTEVCRNDFGECTDSADLGTVWSWEDVMQDTETEDKGTNVFSKGDFGKYNPDNDPEFADDPISFLINDEVEAIDGYKKAAEVVADSDVENKEEILDTIDHIKEEEEEHIEELEAFLNKEEKEEEPLTEGFTFSLNNEKDLSEFTRLCQEVGIKTVGDLDLFARESADEPGNILDKLRAYRADLGPDFKIKESRKPVPEGMTIEQLVEAMEENEDEVECTWCNDVFPKDMCKKEVNLGYLCPRCADGIMARGETLTFKENNYWDFLDEEFDTSEKVDLEYTDLTFTVSGPMRDVDDWDDWEETCDYTYSVDKGDVAAVIWDYMTEEDAKDVEGGLETLEDNDEWEKFMETHFDELFEKYNDKLLDYYEDAARYKCSRNYED